MERSPIGAVHQPCCCDRACPDRRAVVGHEGAHRRERIRPAGLNAFEARRENRSGIYAYEQRPKRVRRALPRSDEEGQGGVDVLPGPVALLPQDADLVRGERQAGRDATQAVEEVDRGVRRRTAVGLIGVRLDSLPGGCRNEAGWPGPTPCTACRGGNAACARTLRLTRRVGGGVSSRHQAQSLTQLLVDATDRRDGTRREESLRPRSCAPCWSGAQRVGSLQGPGQPASLRHRRAGLDVRARTDTRRSDAGGSARLERRDCAVAKTARSVPVALRPRRVGRPGVVCRRLE